MMTGHILQYILILAILCVPDVSSGATIFVDDDVTTSGGGTSWQQAKKTISEAVECVKPGDEVWVAEGHYREKIHIPIGVSFYGGFAGQEVSIAARQIGEHPSVIDASGANYSAVKMNGNNTRIDGFTVTGGLAYLTYQGGGISCRGADNNQIISNCVITKNSIRPDQWTVAGGIFCRGASPLITSCTIKQNTGIGICVMPEGVGDGTSPEIVNCIVSQNQGKGSHAGILIASGAMAEIRRCTVVGNSAYSSGAGIGCSYSSPLIDACIIRGNSAFMGAGIYCGGDSSPLIRNSLIVDNVAFDNDLGPGQGGGVFCAGVASGPNTARFINCTIAGNAATQGSAICLIKANVVLKNCILAQNKGVAAWQDLPEFNRDDWRSAPSVEYCLFYENVNGDYYDLESGTHTGAEEINSISWATANVDGDPELTESYDLGTGSAAIDAGTSVGVPFTDFADRSRPIDIPGLGAEGTGSEYDIGAYEAQLWMYPQTKIRCENWILYE